MSNRTTHYLYGLVIVVITVLGVTLLLIGGDVEPAEPTIEQEIASGLEGLVTTMSVTVATDNAQNDALRTILRVMAVTETRLERLEAECLRGEEL